MPCTIRSAEREMKATIRFAHLVATTTGTEHIVCGSHVSKEEFETACQIIVAAKKNDDKMSESQFWRIMESNRRG